ncbi:GNAT family N-acetyltransferase [Flavobacteriaceae bacterium M23B6Z8]
MASKIWPHNYKNMISGAQIAYMLDLMYSDEALSEQLLKNHVFLIAFEQNNPLGFASYELNFDSNSETRLHKIYVLPEIQGKGVGKALLDEVIKIAGENLNKKISLTVNRTNKAVSFYKKSGFRITASVDKPIGNGFLMEDYIMKKDLIA